MLNYAANAAMYWKADVLQERFERGCIESGRDPEAELGILLGDELENDGFWSRVKQNLDAKRLRLLLVADVIPQELRVVIEFLDNQMSPTEVLALELRRYVGAGGLRTLVPTLYGLTEQSRGLKSARLASREERVSTSFWEEKASSTMPAVDRTI